VSGLEVAALAAVDRPTYRCTKGWSSYKDDRGQADTIRISALAFVAVVLPYLALTDSQSATYRVNFTRIK
jgi:hypothetical protein